MGLSDEVRAMPRRMSRERLDDILGPDDAQEFAELLADPTVPPQSIWRALSTRGIVISNRTISYWATQARSA